MTAFLHLKISTTYKIKQRTLGKSLSAVERARGSYKVMISSRQSRVSGVWMCTLQLFFLFLKSVSPVTQRICTSHKLPHCRNEGTTSFFYWRAVQVLFTCLFSSAYFLFCPHVAATSSLRRFHNPSISWIIFLTSCIEMAFSGVTKYFTIMAPLFLGHSHFWELSVSVEDAT